MPKITPLPAMAAPAIVYPASGGIAGRGRGFAAVESVARVDVSGARSSQRRGAAPNRELDGEARATPRSARGRGEGRIERVGNDDSYGRPSSPFLAQYIGQALVASGGTTAYGRAGEITYRAATERDITILGPQAPVDFYV